METRVGIVDDHRLFREALKALLTSQSGIHVVAEADLGHTGKAIAERDDVDVVLVDWHLPDMSGDAVVREIHRRRPLLPLVAVTMYSDAQHMAEARAAGAAGYVSKEAGFAELLTTIRTVREGGRYFQPGVAVATAVPRTPSVSDGDSALRPLTRRERDVFSLVVRGLRTAEIARELSISGRTVETHRSRILRKLRLHSSADLVRFAAHHGLLD
jgi:two-component system, NarL family, response regulator NreC